MAAGMKELNLEQGMPTVDTALRWLEAELHAARKMGRPGLKLIHGYGSSGTGGKIRTACRKYLRRGAEAGRGGSPGDDQDRQSRGRPAQRMYAEAP